MAKQCNESHFFCGRLCLIPIWATAMLALASCLGAGGSLETDEGSYAATFPADSDWVPMLQAGAGIGDVNTDGSNNGREIIGDANSPAIFTFTDGIDFFIRLRLDDDPSQGTGVRPFGWGVVIDTNQDFTAYEFLIMVDGTGAQRVLFAENTTQGTTGTPNDPAETDIAPYPEALNLNAGGNVQISVAETTFGGDPDYYLDIAVSLSSMLSAGLDFNTPMSFIGGTSNAARALDVDIAGTDATGDGTLELGATDPVFLGGENADPDGDGILNNVDLDDDNDGIPDVQENLLGLDPDGDNDADGVPNWKDIDDRGDGTASNCTAAGTVVCDRPGNDFDSDGDGVPNHIDLDSDNDGIPDIDEAGHGGTDANGDGMLDAPHGANGLADEVETAPESGALDYAVLDTEGDGIPDFLDLDSDGEGGNDINESGNGALDTNNDGRIDTSTTDDDDDGLIDVVDADDATYGFPSTNVRNTDTDSDGIPDPYDADDDGPGAGDSDNDGLDDDVECPGAWPCPDGDGDGTPNYMDDTPDDDNDGVPNNEDDDPNDPNVCRDADNDTCDDCTNTGADRSGGDTDNDGDDNDGDGACDDGDPDDDNDGVCDGADPVANVCVGGPDTAPLDPNECLDSDDDGCDDCSSGSFDPGNDGPDSNGDGICEGDDGDGDGVGDDLDLDDDNDGIPDDLENDAGIDPDADNDNDGIPNHLDADDRGDGTAAMCDDADTDGECDALDPLFDEDGDGQPNHRDLDADGDLIYDSDESGHGGTDADGDGRLDGAAGANGIPDEVETTPDSGEVADPVDTDGDGARDFLDLDSDGDNISDAHEADDGDAGTDPVDTDNDGTPDFRDPDSDGDNISDSDEAGDDDPATAPVDTDNDGTPDFQDRDSDSDDIDDIDEAGDDDTGTDPVDTDNDGTPDFRDPDSDGDGIDDADEAGDTNLGTDPVDTDGDGTPDFQDPDSDNDGVNDGVDNCRIDANADQADWDSDGAGDVCSIPAPDIGGFTVGGGGCTASETGTGSAGTLFLVLVALGFVLRRRRAGALAAGLALILAWTASPAQAQETTSDNFSVERFRLAADSEGVLDIEWGAVPKQHMRWDMAAWLGTANDPLVLYQRVNGGERERAEALVSNRVGATLVGGLALWSRFQIGLELPIILSQSGNDVPAIMAVEPEGFGLGDIRLMPKIQLLDAAKYGVHVAFTPAITLPTGGGSYRGDDGLGFAPEVAASRAFGAVRVAGNLGYRARKNTTLVDLDVKDEIFFRVGAGYRFVENGGPPLEVDLTLSSATASSLFERYNQNHAELLSGASYRVSGPVVAILAGGLGLHEGFGTPDWRLVFGIRLSKDKGSDPDGDGLYGDDDACPLEAEDVDSFQDDDGCPDLDNDGDQIPDTQDGAPNDPEDRDGYEDDDGVPDPDNDNYGILDDADQCPLEAETQNQYEDEDGCPDQLADSDGDGLPDDVDGCPQDPEDMDGFEDGNGCPDPDNDGDGLVDNRDRCADEPGPTENRGCPDTDRDGDTVVDRLDNCPDEAGSPDNQGCAAKQQVRLTGGMLEILDTVYFRTASDTILRRSYPLLRNVATVLNAHPEIKHVRVEGHTDDRGNDNYNLNLSQRRAEAVVAFLVSEGVAEERLVGKGFGETKPIESNKTAAGRAKNRRVEFVILDQPDSEIQTRD